MTQHPFSISLLALLLVSACNTMAWADGFNGGGFNSASSGQGHPDFNNLLAAAQYRFAQKDFPAAAALLEKLVVQEPKNAEAYNLLGKVYHRLGRLEQAKASYQTASSLAPDLLEPRYNLAMLLLDQGDSENSRRIMSEVCKSNANPEYIHDLGVVDEKLGQTQEALLCYQQAVQLLPNNSQFHYSLARRLYLDNQVEASVAEYQKSLQLDPNNIDAHNNLGVALADLGRYPEAVEQYEAALKINSNYPEAQQNLGYAQAHTSLGITYCKQGNSAKALEEYKKALVIDPNFADALYNLGLLYQNQGELDQAVQAYSSAIRSDPNNFKAHNNLGVAYHKLGKSELAKTEYNEALRLKPEFTEAQENLRSLQSGP